MPAWQVDAWIGNCPPLTGRVWRYLSLFKLEDLFRTSTLYLARLDRQEDADEGRWPFGVEDLVFTNGVDPEQLRHALEAERCRTYTSCWTLRRNVYDRMWEEYRAQDGAAVVVQVGNLISALSSATEPLAVGGVVYRDRIDHEWVRRHHRVNTLVLPFQKRTQFSWEQEVRVVHQVTADEPPEAVRVPVCLDDLQVRIMPSPAADVHLLAELLGDLAPATSAIEICAIRRQGDASWPDPS